MNNVRVLFFAIVVFFSSRIFSQTVTFSFDDAPRGSTFLSGEERTIRLIEGLRRAEVEESVFYANSRSLIPGELSDRLLNYAQAGHVIANHTATHSNLEDVAAETFIKNIRRANHVLSMHPNYKKWFRYPYLREAVDDEIKHKRVKAYLNNTGYRQGYVTVEIYDWYIDSKFQAIVSQLTPDQITQFKSAYHFVLWESFKFYEELAKKYLGYSPIHVFLLHENDINALFLSEFIQMLKARGIKVLPASRAFEDPMSDPKWDSCKYSMRRLRTIAESKGASRQETTPKFTDTEYLDGIFDF